MPRLLCTLILALAWPLSAQSKAPVPVADYGKWESLDFTTQISSDGKWMAYRILRSNGNHELRAAPLSSGRPHTAAFGESAAFSADSQWLAYLIGIHEDQEEKLKKAKKPIHKKLGLLRLATSQLTTVENIEAFAFSKSGAFLAMKHYAPERAAAPAEASDPPPDPPAAGLTIRNLASASDASFGSVSSYAWSDAAPVAAMTISNEGKAGNAIQAYDAASGSLRTLDSAAATYHGLTWRPDSSDLAVLRARPDEKRENDNCVLLIFRGAEKVAYDPRADAQFPADTRIVKSRAPSFSEDGARLTVGLAPWDKKEPALKDKPEGDPSNVEVWHSQDPHVMPEQKLRAVRDRDRQTTAVFHIASRHLVQVTANPDEQVQPARFAPRIFTADPHPYEREGMFGREYADMYQVDPASGARVKLLEKAEYIGSRRAGLGPSPTGRYLVHIQKDILFLRDLSTGKETSLTRGLEAAFIDAEFDHPVAQKPPYGIAGWTRDDRSVLIHSQYDLWEFFTDGSKPRRLTDGARDATEHRYVVLDPKEKFIDPSQPMYFRLTGRWTKRTGIARLAGGKTERLLWLDRQVTRFVKAKDAAVFAWAQEAFDEPPRLFHAGPNLANPTQIAETNAFQKDYAWGRAELIEYANPAGQRLQAALFYPANYHAGKRYPLIVNIYEILSTNLHRYTPLSERAPYNRSVFTAQGYFVLLPDIVFRPRDPGRSIVECVSAAVRKVLEKGAVDTQRIGLTGHSWGAYGTTFAVTQTGLFAAAVAGAPLTNLSSSFGDVYWNTGVPETGHLETGQERMEVPLYDDPQAYIRNSATYFANRMNTPLLIAHGDKDGACDIHQSYEMYNAARRAGKQLVLLVYPGENHSLRTKANQLDYHRRMIEWFGHYLKGDPAPAWIARGVTFLERQRELKRLKDAKPADTPPVSSAGTSGASPW